MSGAEINLVFLCTGNAARSVMAGAILRQLREDVDVMTAGTHVIEGQPMSRRTRDALEELGVSAPGHRSHQLAPDDLERADLVVAMAREHVVYVRRNYPGAAPRTATLRRLCRDLIPPPPPLSKRVAALDLEDVALEPWEDVADPAGGDEDVFRACAREMRVLVDALAPRLVPPGADGSTAEHGMAG